MFPKLRPEAFGDIFLSKPRLKLVNSDGDVHFRGFITAYQSAPVAVSGNDQASLNRLTISVGVSYENKLDENQNFNQSFTRFADFAASQNLSSVEDALMNEIAGQLVQDIFNRAFLNW